jgi:hypothetical protein
MTRGLGMSKMIVEISHTGYVLDSKDAIQLVELIAKAELYREKWQAKEQGGTTYHIFPQDRDASRLSLKFLTDNEVEIMRLAGKPEER